MSQLNSLMFGPLRMGQNHNLLLHVTKHVVLRFSSWLFSDKAKAIELPGLFLQHSPVGISMYILVCHSALKTPCLHYRRNV